MEPWSPDIIGIGAEKSATTWAWTILDQHPSIVMSQPKELNFFNEHWDRGIAWYRQHFRCDAVSQKCGEISPHYMDHPDSAARILELCPNARILIMLRNPYDRAVSHLFHDAHKLLGGVSTVTPEDLRGLVLRDDRYLRRSLYGRALQPFIERFPRERLGIFYFESIRNNSRQLVEQLYQFCGVDAGFVPEQLNEKINESTDWYSARMARMAMDISRLAKNLYPTRLMLEWLYRNTKLRERVIRLMSVHRGRPEISFRDVFSDQDSHRILQDMELLESLCPGTVPDFWAVPSETTQPVTRRLSAKSAA